MATFTGSVLILLQITILKIVFGPSWSSSADAVKCLEPNGTNSLILEEKKFYLQKFAKLYDAMQEREMLRGSEIDAAREITLLGSLSDAINTPATPPREYKVIQNYFIKTFDRDGNFNVFLHCNSLSEGDKYLQVQGVACARSLEAEIMG